jgi:hypothetical protein
MPETVSIHIDLGAGSGTLLPPIATGGQKKAKIE